MTVIVIGAGPAGLIAAGTAADKADSVILIEKNVKVGRKLAITGKGRCNITNIAEIEDMITQYPRNSKFLYSALYTFTNNDIINLVESYGVKTKVERGGRVFPVSDSAHDVVAALKKYALRKNVSLVKDTVRELIIRDNAAVGVVTERGITEGDSVIVCTGGKSYPATGSTGDGYRFALQAGHTVTETRASLIPVVTKEKWVRDIMGLSLKNIGIAAYNSKNKKVYSDFGELMFTHFGISGPVVLSMSAYLQNIGSESYRIEIDLKPALSEEKLDSRLMRDFAKFNKKHLINSMGDLLPKALIPVVIMLSGIDGHKSVNTLTRAERGKLAAILKHLPLTAVGVRPVEEAIVTAGGVKTSEINPSTMESKLVKNLYFAGEVIDVDGYTGGYNLQAAYSTGYLAGMNAALNEEE